MRSRSGEEHRARSCARISKQKRKSWGNSAPSALHEQQHQAEDENRNQRQHDVEQNLP